MQPKAAQFDSGRAPRVSVIMPCYNGAAYLSAAVDSVLEQRYRDFELVVVDDGSTDASPLVLKQYGGRIRVLRQANRGLSAARNAGIAVSKGDLLAFLDSDDFWDEGFLLAMVNALDGSGAGIAYCGWQNIGLPGRRGEPFLPPDYEADPRKVELLLENTRWPVHAALVRRGLVESVGGFDPRWRSCEDFALWLELGIHTRLVRVPKVLAYYRHHGGGQMTSRQGVVAENHWRVQTDFLARHAEYRKSLGRRRTRELTCGELLRRGYLCYWRRDLPAARHIFRMVMKTGYGMPADWKYMLPSLLPLRLHQWLIRTLETRGPAAQ